MFGFEIGLTGGIALLLLLLVGLMFILYLVPIPLWIAAWASGAYVGLFTLIGMRLRRVPARYRHHGAHQLGQSRIGYPAERPGSSLPRGRQRRQGRQRHDLGGQGEYSFGI